MKIALIYPPLRHGKEYPLITQNRQFKYTNSREVRIYPLVMAGLATMLKQDGHEVLWLDGINERLEMDGFESRLDAFHPDFCVLETKAPIINRHWEYIARLKARLAGTKVVLVGDHVCYFPEESVRKSEADFVVSHGDYDFICRDLVRSAGDPAVPRPGSVWWKENGEPKNSGYEKFYDLDEAPRIDRDLTHWDLYGEAYLYHPVAYILTGRGCGGANNRDTPRKDEFSSNLPGRCSFCVWQYAFWKAGSRMRKPESVVLEIKELVEKYRVREVFDDNESGPIWNRKWVEQFRDLMKQHGLLGKVRISSNARADSLLDETYCRLLKECGFRLLKIGVESGNDETLKILKKDETIDQIVRGVGNAKKQGMVVLLTTMVGYPWETEEGARSTYEVTRKLMLQHAHFGDSLQASVIQPYPGTPLFNEALKQKWFRDDFDPSDYRQYDMAHPILKTNIDPSAWCRKMWKIHLHPVFLFKSFITLRSINDIILAFRGFQSLLGHLKDY